MLASPVVLACNAWYPVAVLRNPVVLLYSALSPIAVLLLAQVVAVLQWVLQVALP